jgi:hypothetical protein
VAPQLPEYATPTCAVNGAIQVKTSGGGAAGETTKLVTEKVPVSWVGEELSVAVAVNENVPAAVGIPVIVIEVPGDPATTNQLGALALKVNVYGPVPPLALQLAPL